MNTDILHGKWEQLKGEVQKKWGKLTNDEINIVKGDSRKLSGIIQEKYGQSKEEAEKSVNDWLNELNK